MKKKSTKELITELVLEILLYLILLAIGYGIISVFGKDLDSVDPDTAVFIALIAFAVIFGLISLAVKKLIKKKAAEPLAERHFIFTVDDNIIFLKDLAKGCYTSIFDHPYLAMYKRLHKKFGLKVQLNLFYEKEDFDLSMMTDKYRAEWRGNSDWLKLSFHSRLENESPYIDSDYDEVHRDCKAVNSEILRFAGEPSLAKTTTLHWCRVTSDGLKALSDLGVRGLLGLYGSEENPRSSYQSTREEGDLIRSGGIAVSCGIAYAGIDIVLNRFETDEIIKKLSALGDRGLIKVMIHEQYFYDSYRAYQPDFEEKLASTFSYLTKNGCKSAFFEELL